MSDHEEDDAASQLAEDEPSQFDDEEHEEEQFDESAQALGEDGGQQFDDDGDDHGDDGGEDDGEVGGESHLLTEEEQQLLQEQIEALHAQQQAEEAAAEEEAYAQAEAEAAAQRGGENEGDGSDADADLQDGDGQPLEEDDFADEQTEDSRLVQDELNEDDDDEVGPDQSDEQLLRVQQDELLAEQQAEGDAVGQDQNGQNESEQLSARSGADSEDENVLQEANGANIDRNDEEFRHAPGALSAAPAKAMSAASAGPSAPSIVHEARSLSPEDAAAAVAAASLIPTTTTKGVSFSEAPNSERSAPASVDPTPDASAAPSKRSTVVPQPNPAQEASYSTAIPPARSSATVPQYYSSSARSSDPSARPPLAVAELDQLMNRFLGLRVISSGKIDSRVDGEEGKHWVKFDDLPQLSQSNCEKFAPWQPKKIVYQTNKQGIITSIRYNF